MKQSGGIGSILILFEALLLVVVLVLGGMSFLKNPRAPEKQIIVDATEDAIEYISTEETTEVTEEAVQTAQVSFSEDVMSKLSAMSTEDKVAHLFLTSPESLTGNDLVTIAGDGTKAALETYPVAGLIYTKENYKGKTQFGSLLSGAQRYNIEVNNEYLLLAARNTAEDGSETIAISSLYDAGPLQQLVQSGEMQGNEENITYPSIYPANTQNVNTDNLYIIIGNNTDATLTGEENTPCSLSEAAIRSLRDTYSYQGVILTENLSSEAVMSAYPDGQAAVKAIAAGADLVCVTEQFMESYQAVLDAVNSEEIPMSRIDEAVGRVLTMKNNMPAPTDGDIVSETDNDTQTTADQTAQNNNNTQAAAANNTQAAATQNNSNTQSSNNTQTTTNENSNNNTQTTTNQNNNEQAASNNNEAAASNQNDAEQTTNENTNEQPAQDETNNSNENNDSSASSQDNAEQTGGNSDDPESVTQTE